METKIIYLRKAYLVMVSIFIIFMYPVRKYFLSIDPKLYSFGKHFFVIYKEYNPEKVPINFIILGIIFIYLFSFFIPKNLKVAKKNKNIKIVKLIFFIQVLLITFSTLVLKQKFGGQVTFSIYFFSIIIESILSREFIFLLILYNQMINKKNVKLYMFFYIIPSFLLGSKSGLINCLIYYIWLKLVLNEKIITKKIMVVVTSLYMLYPTLYSLSWMVRSGNFTLNFSYFQLKEVMKPLILLSHRISGIDVFMADYNKILNIDLLSTYENILYFFKGIFGNSILKYFSLNTRGYGRVFAEQVFFQPIDLINGYESSLIGTIFYSKNRVTLSIVLALILIISLIIIKKVTQKSKNGVFIVFFLIQINLLILTGLLNKLGITIRFFIIYYILISFTNLGEKNGKRKTSSH